LNIDALILWEWEHDADWVAGLQRAFEACGVASRALRYQTWGDLSGCLASGELRAALVVDRVWDWGGEYAAHVPAARRHVPIVLNDYDLVSQAWNRPTMHYALIERGLRAPHLIVLPRHSAQPDLAPVDLALLGRRFSVKGAHSGGSGVLDPVDNWDEVLRLRLEWPDDETVLQAWIEPRVVAGRRAWFRVFYACGAAFPCWSDDLTHDQIPVTFREESRWGLDVLRGMAQQIAGLCGLNVFSTEIALDERNLWQVVDYVNEPCDFRAKSKTPNGVPDEVLAGIAGRVASWAARAVRSLRSR
jgi:hypothetical protein